MDPLLLEREIADTPSQRPNVCPHWQTRQLPNRPLIAGIERQPCAHPITPPG